MAIEGCICKEENNEAEECFVKQDIFYKDGKWFLYGETNTTYEITSCPFCRRKLKRPITKGETV